jgi:hypothetical protein
MAAKYAALKDDPELKVGAPAYSCPSSWQCLVIPKDLYTSASHVLLVPLSAPLPLLQHVFEDVLANGPAAFQK